ncbi:MAG TPA: B12-binding domain-containing protein [Solirubrobacteraceae bacterium]|jgi:methanogenic corrinoid protein MtbC1
MVAPGASWMPIGELSRRVGVSSDVLRKWERRYGILRPGRTSGNHRLYSTVDEARVRLMLDHVKQGMSPAQAAELAVAARFRIAAGSAPTGMVDHIVLARRRMLDALARYDESAADQVLEKLLARVRPTTIVRDVFLALMREVGEEWAGDRISVAQEHFATGFIHGRLLGLARGWDHGLGPRALLACPSGEQHTLGLIAFGISLHQVGWRITYLGPDTPAGMIAEAAEAVKPELTIVAAVMPGRLDTVADELAPLSRRWTLAVGGSGTSPELAKRVGARHLAADPVTAAAEMLH